MPVSVLLAMILAFGLRLPTKASPLPPGALANRLSEAGLAVVAVGLLAGCLGLTVRVMAARSIISRSSRRTLLMWGSRLLLVTSLGVFAWTLIALDWPRVVGWGLGLKNLMLLEQAALILPFLLSQILIWTGLYPAEKLVLPQAADRRFGNYLLLKVRHSFGMIIPMAILYGLTRQFSETGFATRFTHPVWPAVGSLVMGAVIFLASPAFVRLTWPTRRLADGPLRDRLERLARRLKFRYTDLLLWDTGGLVVNAGVTGAVPWFRYVLITDAMVDVLDDREIEAVFGHEVGHIAHWHLAYFAIFCVGSMGFMTLVYEGASRAFGLEARFDRLFGDSATAELGLAALQIVALGVYFYAVFGFLSRQFERQADVYGSRAVSCGRTICPFDHDPNGPLAPAAVPDHTCSGGIHLFAETLSQVAEVNGSSPKARSWRHGSIARRVEFLYSLGESPGAEDRFQTGVRRLRWGIFAVLTASSAAAFWLMSQEVGR